MRRIKGRLIIKCILLKYEASNTIRIKTRTFSSITHIRLAKRWLANTQVYCSRITTTTAKGDKARDYH